MPARTQAAGAEMIGDFIPNYQELEQNIRRLAHNAAVYQFDA